MAVYIDIILASGNAEFKNLMDKIYNTFELK